MKDNPDAKPQTPPSTDKQEKSAFQQATEKPPLFNEARKMFMKNNGFNLDDTNVYNLDLEGEKRTKLMLSLRNRIISVNLPDSGLPSRDKMHTFYDAAADALNGHQLPITKYADLKFRKSAIPQKFTGDDEAKVQAIGGIIMSFIATNIPPENEILQSIILPHQLRNDGYGALYSLVYLTTPWLRSE